MRGWIVDEVSGRKGGEKGEERLKIDSITSAEEGGDW